MNSLDVYMLARVVFLDMPDARIGVYEVGGLSILVKDGTIREPGRSNVLTLDDAGDVQARPAFHTLREVDRVSVAYLGRENLATHDYPGGWHPWEVGARLLDLRQRHLDRLGPVTSDTFPQRDTYGDLLNLLDRERLDRQIDIAVTQAIAHDGPGPIRVRGIIDPAAPAADVRYIEPQG